MVCRIGGEQMGRVKSTLSIDKEVWEEFKRHVVAKYGNLRKLSVEAEEALSQYTSTRFLSESARLLGVTIKGYPSSQEVKANRSRVKVSASQIIREARDEREKSISRL